MPWQLDPALDSGHDWSERPSLRQQPELYPGRQPSCDYVYRQGRTWELSVRNAERLTRAKVKWKDVDNRSRTTAITNLFSRWGGTEVTQRIPVLAIGSNAYPRQMYDKLYRDTLVDDSLLCVRGIVSNLEIAYCPFVGTNGYLPVTVRFNRQVRSHVWLQLLTISQLLEIIETEVGYELVFVPARVAPFQATASDERPAGYYMFWCTRFLKMSDFGGLPPVCEGTVAETSDATVPSRTFGQRQLQDRLGLTDLIDANALRSEATLTSAQKLRIENSVRDANERLLPCIEDRDPPADVEICRDHTVFRNYGDLLSAFGENSSSAVMVRRSGPVRPRIGDREILAALPASFKQEQKIGKQAVMYRHVGVFQGPRSIAEPLRQIATAVRVVNCRVSHTGDGLPQAQTDEMARNAIGTWPGETCYVSPLHLTARQHLAQMSGRIFSVRTLAGRAVRASKTTMERPICWLDPNMLAALGVDEGGTVVVGAVSRKPGVEPPSFVYRCRRLQAFPSPHDELVARRDQLHPEDLDALYPNPSETLGVSPDLPWVWIDHQTRAMLGLGALDTVAPVIVRPSVRYLLVRMFGRFILAALGVGAGIAVLSQQITSRSWPAATVLQMPADLFISSALFLMCLAVCLWAVFLNSKR